MKRSLSLVAALALSCLMTSAVARAWSINSAGQITRDSGEPFFPFGFYHVSWVQNRTGADRIADLNQMADAGFDLMSASLDPTFNIDDPGFLQQAAARNVSVIGEIYWDGKDIIIPLVRDYPAVAGYVVVDDFNYPPTDPPYSPQEVGDRTAALRLLARPNQIAYGSGSGYPCCELGDYAPYLDVIGPQVYPVGSDPDRYDLLWSLRSWTHVEAELGDHPVLANIQTMRWGRKRYPSRLELRNLLYVAIIHGVDGVLAYTFWDESGLLPLKSPTTWDEIKILRSEVREMEPALLGSARRVVTYPNQYLQAGVWESSANGWVVVLNVHWSQSLQVSVPLPGWNSATPAFAGRATTLSLTNGALSGIIPAEAVQVFRLSR